MSATTKNLYMEKRTADGTLDFSEPRAPFMECSEDDLAKYYFRNTPKDGPNPDMATIRAWFASQGFTIRPKTW